MFYLVNTNFERGFVLSKRLLTLDTHLLIHCRLLGTLPDIIRVSVTMATIVLPWQPLCYHGNHCVTMVIMPFMVVRFRLKFL